MKHFKAIIKERGKDGKVHVLHPEFIGNATREELVAFWGLNEPDVLEWNIEESNE